MVSTRRPRFPKVKWNWDYIHFSQRACHTAIKFWHGVLQGEGLAVQIRHDPKNFRTFLHWKHCFCSDKDKEKSEFSREEGGGWRFSVKQCLAYGWRGWNLNWPISIQRTGKILVSWRHSSCVLSDWLVTKYWIFSWSSSISTFRTMDFRSYYITTALYGECLQ